MMEVVSSEIEIRRGGRRGNTTLPSMPTSGFPAKSITRHTKLGKGSGQWIIAYQAEQRKRLKTSLIPAAIDIWERVSHTESGRPTVPKNTPASTSAKYRRILDKELLLSLGYVNEPQDLCVVNISGLDLSTFNDDYFDEFTCLASVCASDNRLPIEAFEIFTELQDLELSLNNITNISITPDTFIKLTRLDLSYNSISSSAITTLGMMKELKELHLTGNSIVYLPIEMSQLQPVDSNRDNPLQSDESSMINFPKLEKLWLDSNHISDTGTFAILAGLRRLQYLNLDDNHLSCIPRLKLSRTYNSLALHPTSPSPITSDDLLTTGGGGGGGGRQEEEGEDPLIITNNSATSRQINSSPLRMAPFPRLHTLSLADNMIISADNLIGCDVWPTLTTLIIAGNPIVTLNKGLPPLIQQELVDIAGISVLRTKQNSHKNKQKLVGSKARNFIKVSTAPPPLIPKIPLLLALEPPPPSFPSLTSTPGGYYEDEGNEEEFGLSEEESSVVSGSTSFTSERLNNDTVHEMNDESVPQNRGPNIFMTQPQNDDNEDLPVPQTTPTNDTVQSDVHVQPTCTKEVSIATLSISEELKRRRTAAIDRNKNVPHKYKGYECLLETPDDSTYYDGPPIPTDVRACARALKHVLRNPLQLTDAKTASKTKPVIEPEYDTTQYLRKTPVRDQYDDTPAISRREVLVQTVLEDMRTHETVIESNLADMLSDKPCNSKQPSRRKGGTTATASEGGEEENKNDEKWKEGEKLLIDLQKKFNKVCQSSLRAIQSLEGVQEATLLSHQQKANQSN